MNYRDKHELQERLAAEYVLGTLCGRARLRFQRWLRTDEALRQVVARWEERLAPMVLATREVAPPPSLWRSIEAKIEASATMKTRVAQPAPAAKSARSANPGPSWWDSVAFWRNWGLVATGCAVALSVATAIREPQVREVVRTVEADPNQMQPSYIAMLEDGKGNMAFMAYAGRKSDELWVKRLAMAPLPAGMTYELWGMPDKPGMPAKSLGMVPSIEKGTIKLAAVADQSLSDFPRLAITMEPMGGAPNGQPTGPMMYKGDCHKFW
jgi:anti-sigma-K factor RskA